MAETGEIRVLHPDTLTPQDDRLVVGASIHKFFSKFPQYNRANIVHLPPGIFDRLTDIVYLDVLALQPLSTDFPSLPIIVLGAFLLDYLTTR